MKNKKSMLIVGAGLSGICVSLQLLKRGCSVTLVDNQKNVSSRVAVGMINPLVFRRMTKSWRVDEFLPYLKTFYRELEKETKYFGMVSMYKVKIEDSRLLLLNDSFRSLSSISIQEKSNNIHLRKFEKDLSIIIRNDFQTRYPSNDTDTD